MSTTISWPKHFDTLRVNELYLQPIFWHHPFLKYIQIMQNEVYRTPCMFGSAIAAYRQTAIDRCQDQFCEKSCPPIDEPVCGLSQDQQAIYFANSCVLDNHNCISSERMFNMFQISVAFYIVVANKNNFRI